MFQALLIHLQAATLTLVALTSWKSAVKKNPYGEILVGVISSPATRFETSLSRVPRQAGMSNFNNLAPRSAGLSESTLEEYQHRGTILELYFNQPVDFHLPFNDLQPTALLIPIEGRHADQGYVFRGKNNKWLAGQMLMSDPQPLLDALSTLGYIR